MDSVCGDVKKYPEREPAPDLYLASSRSFESRRTDAMAHHEPIRRTLSNIDIPDKLYFRIGDVAKLCEVPAYVLRFWESEFPQLKPNKGGTGQRLYRRKDVEMALRIKRLLYEEGYTIPGARQIFKQEQHTTGPQLALAIEPTPSLPARNVRRLRLLRKELQDLHGLLCGPLLGKQPSGLQMIRGVRPTRPPHGLALTSRNAASPMEDLFNAQTSLATSPDVSIQD